MRFRRCKSHANCGIIRPGRPDIKPVRPGESGGLLDQLKACFGGQATGCDNMTAQVAVTTLPAAQPSQPAVYDGKDELNSPLPGRDFVAVSNGDAGAASAERPAGAGTKQDDVRSLGGSPVHSGKSTGDGQQDVTKAASAAQESLPNGDYTMMPDQTGKATTVSDISCNCPDAPRTRPAAPSKLHLRPNPRKPLARVTPPKLPPKPPHLLQHRSPSSDSLTGRGSADCPKDRLVGGRDRRSQSVSVVGTQRSPPREESPGAKPGKRPVPTPRKFMPVSLDDASPAALGRKALSPRSPDARAWTPVSELLSPVAGSPSPKSSSGGAASPDSWSGRSSPIHKLEEGSALHSSRAEVVKSPKKPSVKARHIRVRERAAIFEKLIEVETTRNRGSQLSEPRSRISSRASDFGDATPPRVPDGRAKRSGDRHHSYINVQQLHESFNLAADPLQRKDDDALSVMSTSSDDVFSSRQSSAKSQPHRPPSPNLSEDDDFVSTISNRTSGYSDVVLPDSNPQSQEKQKVSQRDSDYTDVVLPESHTRDSDYTDVVLPESHTRDSDYTDVVLPESHTRDSDYTDVVLPESHTTDSDCNDVILPESHTRDADYTDVVIPESRTHQDSLKSVISSRIEVISKSSPHDSDGGVSNSESGDISLDVQASKTPSRGLICAGVDIPDPGTSADSLSPKVALAVARPAPRPSEPRLSIPVGEGRAHDSPAPAHREMLSPDSAPSLPKPFHGDHAFRNVTPLLCGPPRPAKPCSSDQSSPCHSDSADNRPAHKPMHDVTRKEAHQDQEGTEMKTADTDVTVSLTQHSEAVDSLDRHQQTGPVPDQSPEETSDMSPAPHGRDRRSKSHPTIVSKTVSSTLHSEEVDSLDRHQQTESVPDQPPEETSDMSPASRRREPRSKSHPTIVSKTVSSTLHSEEVDSLDRHQQTESVPDQPHEETSDMSPASRRRERRSKSHPTIVSKTVSSTLHSEEVDSLDRHQQTESVPDQPPVETSDMSPASRRRERRSKSHPMTASSTTVYEVYLPGSFHPFSLTKAEVAPMTGESRESPVAEEPLKDIVRSEVGEHTYENEGRTPQPQSTDQRDDGESSDMLCNRSRRQRFAVKKRDSNPYGGQRKKWQQESAPASLPGLERQEAIPKPPEDADSPPGGNRRLSQVSSAGSTISSLISNVSMGDADDLSSDDEDYVDVQVPSSDGSGAGGAPPLKKDDDISLLPPKADIIPLLPPKTDTIPLLPPKTDTIPLLPPKPDGVALLRSDVRNREEDLIPLPSVDTAEDATYSTLYECQGDRQEAVREDDAPPQGIAVGDEEEQEKELKVHVPVEIEMQPMKTKSPHSPEKESRRRAFEFHMPLFLKNSSSVESTMSASQTDDRRRHWQATHSEDSDASSDFVGEAAPPPGARDSERARASTRDSGTSCEQSEDSWSLASSHLASTDSLNVSLQSAGHVGRRRRQGSGGSGRPLSEYDRPVSSTSTDYDRPVSCISTDYDRPVSSSSADYIGVLNSFHKDGKKDEDSVGFSFTWTVNHGDDGAPPDETYRPKSEEVLATPAKKYASPRKANESTTPVPVRPVAYKALKPPKTPRPYSEPSLRKIKRNSLVQGKILPVPSKEEITEQFCKISRQRSRFVSQEPLFQIYQEDARSRDSYLRLLNISSLESLAAFLEKQEARKKEKRDSEPLPDTSQLPEYRVLIPDEEVYQSAEDSQSGGGQSRRLLLGDNKNLLQSGEEAIYQSAEPVYEPPGDLFYDTGDILQNNTIYESGSLGSSTGEGSGGSGSDVEIPKPYGLMQRSGGVSNFRRSYWSELPEVVSSGLLEQMTLEEKRLQEALFEVVTSEASYLRSLNLVVEHFSEAITLQPPTGLLNKVQHHRLFSNIKSVRDASERLLLDLEERQQDSVIISDVCDILLQHFEKGGFNCYIVYCANNQYQVKMLEELRKNMSFIEAIKLLESSPACCCLDLQSFLMLPFQRITRLPLLIEAIRQQAKPDSPLHTTAMQALTALRNMAEKCNEEAKRMEMIEEVTQLANQLDFREGVKKMNLSQTTSIVKRGRLHIIKKDNKILNRGKLIAKAIYIIVFTDKVAVCKQKIKGEQLKYDVFDWCPRNLVQVESVPDAQQHSKLPDGVPSTCKHVIIISFLQNNQKKEMEYCMDANSEAERERWMDAMHPAKRTQDGETIYESWDCPQVMCKQPYEAQDRDELTLDLYDRVDVDKKIEGWYYGSRVSDHAKGWFPARFTQEVVNDHVLARNLKQRHKLLSLCDQRLRAKNFKK